MEQRKRESVIPKGTFGGTPAEADQRGDVSGTFLRYEIEPAPVARIELRRQVLPAPPPAGAKRSLPPPPPPPRVQEQSSILPPSFELPLPPPVPTTTPAPLTLRALVAPSYPPPAPVEEERVEFPDFGLRLDVQPIAPAPISLLPPPGQEQERSLRPLVIGVALLGVIVAGWFARDLLGTRSPARIEQGVAVAATLQPAIEPVALAPEAPEVVEAVQEEVAPPETQEATVEAVDAPIAAAPVVAAAVAAAPIVAAPVVVSEKVAPTVKPQVQTPRASNPVPQVAAPAVQNAPVVAAPVVAAPAVVEEHAPSLEAALSEALPESLERDEVIEGIEILRNEYSACAGDLHGVAEVRITIANTGRISHALVGGDFAGTPQGSCLARTLRQARFRSFLQPRLDIVYPLAL